MKHTLVGYTGFVGGNLLASNAFDNLYNSSNINQSFGEDNGLVIYSGMPSEKFLANSHPEQDLEKAKQALENMRRMKPKQLVLISTVDVYQNAVDVDENTPAGGADILPYGKHRGQLEEWVQEHFPSALIVRLPALFGRRLKKNFVYDMITLCPPMLKEDKFLELNGQSNIIEQFYKKDDSGFYRIGIISQDERAELKTFFEKNEFNSLKFTDSRSVFQLYDLSRLWQDISNALEADLRLVNMATVPLSAADLYSSLFKKEFNNHLEQPPFNYNMRTMHNNVMGGKDGYLMDRQQVLEALENFVQGFYP